MSRPHLLYTAWSFPPSRAGGVYRALATVNAFVQSGWDVTVLTVPQAVFEETTGIDPTLEAKVAAAVEVVRVDPDIPSLRSDLATWGRIRARYLEVWRGADRLRDLRGFPEPAYGRWAPRLKRATERIHAEHPVDLAIGTANPNVDFVPGRHLHERFGVPYVMDYRDAWTLDVFTGRPSHSWVPGAERTERSLIAAAEEVWFVNEPIRRWHQAKYAADATKMHVVANGFDQYDVPLAVPVRPSRKTAPVFGYIGTLSDQVPIRPLLDGWRLALASGRLTADARLVLHGYLGHFGDGAAATALREAPDSVEFRGPVGKTTIGETYSGFDVLVLALGTGKYVTSGKVYEYAATGIPIVSVHDPRNAATDVVRDAPGWQAAASLRPDDIAAALARSAAVAAAQTPQDREVAQRWGAQFAREAQLAPRIAALTARFGAGEAQ